MCRIVFHKIFAFVSLILIVLSQFPLQNTEYRYQATERKKFVQPVIPSSIYIYRAYYDDRSIQGTIRILAISKCFTANDTIMMHYSGKVLPLSILPVEATCPWSWAKNCQWNAHHLQSPKIRGLVPKKVSITFNGDRQVDVAVDRRPPVAKDKLQVCVPPLYWYHDWPRMILFFELWKKHLPTFIIYANSYSKNAGKVLDYYQRKASIHLNIPVKEVQGVVRIVNWPMLERSKDGADPNGGIYRLSHSLAHNDCVLRMEGEYGALLDIDEYIHIPGNTTLLEFAKREFQKDAKLGSLQFEHNGLKVPRGQPSGNGVFAAPMDASFDGVNAAVSVNATGPGKTVFKPDLVKFLSTHWVHTHSRVGLRRKKVPRDEALLLHNRVRFRDDQLKNAVETKFSDLDMEEIQRQARITAREIFGDRIPSHNEDVSVVMDKCDASWRSQGCKVPLLHCRKELEKTDEWVFLPPADDSHYTIL